jgi:D-alanine-D-alanine ligase
MGKRVAVVFGSRSGEHEVSVISAHQVMEALEVAGHDVLPIYITKTGEWYAGPGLNDIKAFRRPGFHPSQLSNAYRVSLSPDVSIRQLLPHPDASGLFKRVPQLWADVFFPVMHGTFGEDGTLQGLFEMADVPFVGPDALASGLGMDKGKMKAAWKAVDLPLLDCDVIARSSWKSGAAEFIRSVEKKYGYPLMVKPVCLGSSIGVARADNPEQLKSALETALVLDDHALVERALSDFIEINCSVLGPPYQASVCEQPNPKGAVLTFEDKYKRGGGKGGKGGKSGGGKSSGMASLDRIIPAPISKELTAQVQELAIKAFATLGCSGVSRIDFLFENSTQKLYVNEINTIPGSLSFYLWEPAGVPFPKLVDKLVNIALERHTELKATQFSFEANLLQS